MCREIGLKKLPKSFDLEHWTCPFTMSGFNDRSVTYIEHALNDFKIAGKLLLLDHGLMKWHRDFSSKTLLVEKTLG